MAKKKITRKELLKKEDEFISFSQRCYDYVSAHRKQIHYLLIGLLIVIAIGVGAVLYVNHINNKAIAAYQLVYKKLVSDFPSESKENALQQSAEAFDKLIKMHGRTKIATLAVPQLASLKFAQGSYDDAISLYRSYLKKNKSGPLYSSMAHFGLAAAYEAKGDHQSAINSLKSIIAEPGTILEEEALFSLGRVYALAGQQEMSREIFQKFVNQFKESPLLPLAKTHLKQ